MLFLFSFEPQTSALAKRRKRKMSQACTAYCYVLKGNRNVLLERRR